jgi:hypothetical protein
MKRYAGLSALFAVFVVMAVASGCKPGPVSAEKAFANAPAEIKEAWQKASDAAKSNDYTGALLLLQDLRARPGLSAEQGQAAERTAAAVSDRMYDAAAKGDAKAKEALDQMRKARGR